MLGFFTITVIVYGDRTASTASRRRASPRPASALLALAPIILFNYVGFELGNGAAEEMVNPQRDVPVAVARSAVHRHCGCTRSPIFGIVFVLPPEAITGLGGFIDAINRVHGVRQAPRTFC